MFTFFGKENNGSHYKVDFHSHLVPGIDDGCRDLEESMEVLRGLSGFGYTKIITTPHIHTEYFPNTEEILRENFSLLKEELQKNDIPVELELAAEYYADDSFLEKISAQHPFLTFGNKHILVETAFINRPVFLDAMIFELSSKGYQVILAHPERYLYLQEHFDEAIRLKSRGVFFQINLGSLSGMYAPEVKRMAEKLIDKKLVDFVGTDCHHAGQLDVLQRSFSKKSYKKLKKLPILNDNLL